DLVPLEPVERWLETRWSGDAEQRIADVLRVHDHLKPQPVVEGRRVSYFFTDPVRALDAKRDVETLGFDVLMSDNQYFDILPPGVRKGPTLLRMLDALSIPREHVLV